MVFFTCSGCGESLKKNKVENHTYTCKYCEYLTCIDCSEDFYGNDYKRHTSCMTEDQKYSAKGTEFKPNKGDVKQQQWLKHIEDVIVSDITLSKRARDLLSSLKNYDNIPRKRAKFLNFIKNSLRIYDNKLGEEVWEIFSGAAAKPAEMNTDKGSEVNQDTQDSTCINCDKEESTEEIVNGKGKKNKAEKHSSEMKGMQAVEVMKKKKSNKETSDEIIDKGNHFSTGGEKRKKKKSKNKEMSDLVVENGSEPTCEDQDSKRLKKKKSKASPGEVIENGDNFTKTAKTKRHKKNKSKPVGNDNSIIEKLTNSTCKTTKCKKSKKKKLKTISDALVEVDENIIVGSKKKKEKICKEIEAEASEQTREETVDNDERPEQKHKKSKKRKAKAGGGNIEVKKKKLKNVQSQEGQ